METKKKRSSRKSNDNGRETSQKHTTPTETIKKPAEFQSSLIKIASGVNSVGDELSWELRNEFSTNDPAQTTEPDTLTDPIMNKNCKESMDKPEKKRAMKSRTKKESAKGSAKRSTPSTPIGSDKKENGLDSLWETAKSSKSKKPKESQVWIDGELYRKIEMLNIKHGKPVPTKHVVNAFLCMFIAEHKLEFSKTSRGK